MTDLIEAGKKGGSASEHYWTEEERDIVRREYDGHNASAQRIASKLRVTFCAVKGQVQKMGLAVDKSSRWTDEELELLREWIHKYSIITIARRLHRSLNSVEIKATRLKMGLRIRDGWFHKAEVCEILGVDHKKIQGYIDRGELKASWRNGNKPQKNGMAMWRIETADLRDFIKQHAGDFQGRNVDLTTIVWLLNGDIE